MNLYLITFQSSLNRIESVYDCHKDLFVEIEKFFTLHLVPYTEAASIPADAYRMAFIASGGVEKMVTQHFELLPYPIHLLTDGQQNSLAASLEIATWIRSKGMKVHIIRRPARGKRKTNRSCGIFFSVAGGQQCRLPACQTPLGNRVH